MGPEERAGEAPVLFSDWTVSERQERSWVASGQDGTAGGEAEPQGSLFLGKPLCATGAPPKRVAQGVSGRLGFWDWESQPHLFPSRTVSSCVSLEISPPRGLSLEGLETSLTLGAQQGPLQKCPAIGAHVQEPAEESRRSSDVHGEGRADCGREGSRDFYKTSAMCRILNDDPTVAQQRSPLCAKFTNGKTESQKELEASVRQPALMETNYRGTSRAASVCIG